MKRFFIFGFNIFLIMLLMGQARQKLSKEKEYEILSKEIEGFWINSPLVLNDKIIFFYKGFGFEKKVVVAGDFTDWKPLLLMERKSTNMWQFVWEERLKKGRYRYKYVIDDIWTYDPNNTNFIIDENGDRISYFDLEEDFIPEFTNPLWIEKDIYEFKYFDEKAQRVSVVGNFNNWNPYKHPLKYRGAGEFSIRVRLKPGIYAYCFVVDDYWVPDPKNLRQFKDKAGNVVSVFYVK